LFLTYEQQVLWPVRQFGRILADTGKTRVALGRIAELLVLEKERDLDYDIRNDSFIAQPDYSASSIEFRDVSFTYPDGTEVLKHISFTVNPGEHLAIVGPTGSGKSTLVHLLLRFYEPTDGTILIGGRDIRTIPKKELRNRISIVLQDSFLYGKTVRENILIGYPDVEETGLIEAAKKAAFHHVALGFQDGYETMVGERGVTLSGGQRQRLALARALLRQSPILVLDDSLSAVDTETDRLIREAIGKGSQGAKNTGPATTTIIIAHRLTTLAEADTILVLEAGRITGMGSHDRLIQQPGFYQRLATLQSAVHEM
jgi:ATP-binding cassette subfamily B protein